MRHLGAGLQLKSAAWRVSWGYLLFPVIFSPSHPCPETVNCQRPHLCKYGGYTWMFTMLNHSTHCKCFLREGTAKLCLFGRQSSSLPWPNHSLPEQILIKDAHLWVFAYSAERHPLSTTTTFSMEYEQGIDPYIDQGTYSLQIHISDFFFFLCKTKH